MTKNKITASLSLRMDFQGVWVKKLSRIKDYSGIQATTDIIRYLINEKYREIQNEEEKFI